LRVDGHAVRRSRLFAQFANVCATPELRKLLGPVRRGGTGLGNHKELVRFLAAVGRRLGDE